MKCKFCGSQNTEEISITYVGDSKALHRHALAQCKNCSRIFGYISNTEFPKIISTEYTTPQSIECATEEKEEQN